MSDQNSYNLQIIEEFRANGGKVSGRLAHTSLLLLTTIGARSGQPRTVPLGYLRDDDRMVVFASAAGAPTHPDWYHNLVANPQVIIEVGTETFNALADVMEGAERERLWTNALQSFPFLADHQAKTTRQIPVIVISH